MMTTGGLRELDSMHALQGRVDSSETWGTLRYDNKYMSLLRFHVCIGVKLNIMIKPSLSRLSFSMQKLY